ncbi:MAG: hypothetical protein ACTIKT_15450 [Microbacterium sp.]
MTSQNTIVTIEHETLFPAAHIPDARWNGFAIPGFTREQVTAVIAWSNALAATFPDDTVTLEWDGDTLYEIADYGDGPERDEVPTSIIDGQPLYYAGNGWTWEIPSEDDE